MFVVDQIYKFACETPDHRAMVHDLEPVTYRALHLMIARMRERLSAQAVRGGAGVAVVHINSIKVSWFVDLALRSLGLVTVAINSPAELEALSDLDVVLVVTAAEDGAGRLPTASFPAAPRIAVETSDWRVIDDGAPLERPPSAAQGGHILFTSGTTGLRKKIMFDTQEGLLTAGVLELYRDRSGFREIEWSDMMVNLLNFGLWTSGGYGAAVLFWGAGGGVVLHQGPAAERSFAVPGLTHAFVTPAMLDQLLAAPPSVLPRNDNLQVCVGAGALSIPLANRVKARLTNGIVTTLGSTEGGMLALTPIETADDLRWHRLDPSRDVEVVDERHRPLPPGHLGQVRVLQEPGAPREYIGDPVATRAFFRDGRFYPGDLGVLDGKGRLMLSGRVTDVLVVKGDKIPSGPIEEELQTALDLHGVCVLSEQAPDGTDVMHIVLEREELYDPARLEALSKPYLAYFPRVSFHNLAAFPRNANGKVERLRLREMLYAQQKARAAE